METTYQVTPFLHVPDLEQAIAFFGSLAFELRYRQSNYAYLELDGCGLRVLEEPARRLTADGKSRPTVYVDVADIDALHARLSPVLAALPPDRVEPLMDKPYGQREFQVRMPDGDWLTFWRTGGVKIGSRRNRFAIEPIAASFANTEPMQHSTALTAIKLFHTAAWAFFAGCILLLPFAAHAGRFGICMALVSFVLLEILILAVNNWRCPLTGVAARHTQDRRDNFDIFLPLWLARYNKQVFGSLFVAGLAYTAFEWWRRTSGA